MFLLPPAALQRGADPWRPHRQTPAEAAAASTGAGKPAEQQPPQLAAKSGTAAVPAKTGVAAGTDTEEADEIERLLNKGRAVQPEVRRSGGQFAWLTLWVQPPQPKMILKRDPSQGDRKAAVAEPGPKQEKTLAQRERCAHLGAGAALRAWQGLISLAGSTRRPSSASSTSQQVLRAVRLRLGMLNPRCSAKRAAGQSPCDAARQEGCGQETEQMIGVFLLLNACSARGGS